MVAEYFKRLLQEEIEKDNQWDNVKRKNLFKPYTHDHDHTKTIMLSLMRKMKVSQEELTGTLKHSLKSWEDHGKKLPKISKEAVASAPMLTFLKIWQNHEPKLQDSYTKFDQVTFDQLVRRMRVTYANIFPLVNYVSAIPLKNPRIVTVGYTSTAVGEMPRILRKLNVDEKIVEDFNRKFYTSNGYSEEIIKNPLHVKKLYEKFLKKHNLKEKIDAFLEKDLKIDNIDRSKFNKEFPGCPTAFATPNGEFVFNVDYLQSHMRLAEELQIKPSASFYVSNGGNIPDCYSVCEFIIMHEFYHYVMGDFYLDRVIPGLNKDPLKHKAMNYATDFRSNYDLLKAGFTNIHDTLISNLFNFDNYDRILDIYEEVYEEMSKGQNKAQSKEEFEEQMKKYHDTMKEVEKQEKEKQEQGEKSQLEEDDLEDDLDDNLEEALKKLKDHLKKMMDGSQGDDDSSPGEDKGDSPGNSPKNEEGQKRHEEMAPMGNNPDHKNPMDSGMDEHQQGSGEPKPGERDADPNKMEERIKQFMDKLKKSKEQDTNRDNPEFIANPQQGQNASQKGFAYSRDEDRGITTSKAVDWKQVLARLVKTGMSEDRSYLKISKSSITQSHLLKKTGAAAVKPGLKLQADQKVKLLIVTDTSGSMYNDTPRIFGELRTLFQVNAGIIQPDFLLLKWHSYYRMYQCQLQSASGSTIKGTAKLLEHNYGQQFDDAEKAKSTKPIPLHTLFTKQNTGGNAYTKDFEHTIESHIHQDYVVLFLGDEDVLYTADKDIDFRRLIKSYKTRLFVVNPNLHSYERFKKALGFSTDNIGYMK